MRNEGVLDEIRRVPMSLLQPKFEKIGQNVILQKVYITLNISFYEAETQVATEKMKLRQK